MFVSDTIPPLTFQWNGEALVPLSGRMADRYYVIGEKYRMAPWEDRSANSHNHEFAWLAEAWKNLPEAISDLYPSPEHLRKRALIEAGWYNEEIIDAGSKAAALRVSSYVRRKDDFALVITRGPLVVVRTAKSQSRRAMNREEFQASKTAIMEIVSALTGVSPQALNDNAGQAA